MVARKTNGAVKTTTQEETMNTVEQETVELNNEMVKPEQDYEAVEKEHLGDPVTKTGIYAEEPDPVIEKLSRLWVEKPTPMMLLIEALAKARAEFDSVTKNAKNPFFKSKYADLAEVLGAITPALSSNGLVVVQPIEQTEKGLLLRTQLYHVGGGLIESTFAIPENKDIQKLGSSITYIRRYSLSALFGVAPEDDDGNSAAGKGGNNNDKDAELKVVYMKTFAACNDADSLKAAFTDAVNTVPSHKEVITACKDVRKKELGI